MGQSTVLGSWLTHSVIKLFQARDGEETLHADSIFNQELYKINPIQDQGIQHRLLQGIDLQRGGEGATSMELTCHS